MPTEYPLRTDSNSKNDPREICECGHADIYHEGYSGDGKTNCTVCLCPKYVYEQTLTVTESINLRLHLMRVADKSGNQQ